METNNEYLCPSCMSMVEEWGKPRRSFMGFFKVICPNCKKEFRYPLSPGYTACYWILLIGNVVWALYLISQGRFGPNPIGLVVLIFVIISLFKSSKLKREIEQLKEKLPNLSEEITECVKCGGRNFEHDIYRDEYNCENCGWTSKEKPKGKVNVMELQTKDNEIRQVGKLLEVGMPLGKIVELLGPPSGSMGGADVVNKIRNMGASISPLAMRGKTFMEWDRPEGLYKLVIEDGILARIYSAPEGIEREIETERKKNISNMEKVSVDNESIPIKPKESNTVYHDIKNKIWEVAGPTNITLRGYDYIVGLGEQAVSAAIDILRNPENQYGMADQIMLVEALVEFAKKGNKEAIKVMNEIVLDKVAIFEPYGDAQNIAYKFLSEKK